MNLNCIESFLAVVDTQSVTKAAEKLYLSQSTVSYRLKQLEDDLDCELISRAQGQRNSILTPRGEAFLPLARRAMGLTQDLSMFKNSYLRPSLNIGCADSLNLFFFSGLYNRIIRDQIPIELHVQSQNSRELYTRIANNLIDIGFTIDYIRTKDIIVTPLFSEQMKLICPRGKYPEGPVDPAVLEAGDELAADLCPEEFRLWHDNWWDPQSSPFIEVNSPTLIQNFLQVKPCWAILPVSAAATLAKRLPEYEVRDLSNPPPHRICFMLSPRQQSATHEGAIKTFLTCARDYLKELDWIELLEPIPL